MSEKNCRRNMGQLMCFCLNLLWPKYPVNIGFEHSLEQFSKFINSPAVLVKLLPQIQNHILTLSRVFCHILYSSTYICVHFWIWIFDVGRRSFPSPQTIYQTQWPSLSAAFGIPWITNLRKLLQKISTQLLVN